MKSPVSLALLVLAAMLFAGCGSTPKSRIENDPARYNQLSSKDKEMVAQGRIRIGMTQNAVYLAWGKPNAVSKGESSGGSTERWTYIGQTPVWSNQFNFGYGGGYGYRYGRYYDYGPTVTYIPYAAGVVHFRNGRVSKWEETGR